MSALINDTYEQNYRRLEKERKYEPNYNKNRLYCEDILNNCILTFLQ